MCALSPEEQFGVALLARVHSLLCTPPSYLLAFGVAGGGIGLRVVLPLKRAVKRLQVVLAEGVCPKVLSGTTAAAL